MSQASTSYIPWQAKESSSNESTHYWTAQPIITNTISSDQLVDKAIALCGVQMHRKLADALISSTFEVLLQETSEGNRVYLPGGFGRASHEFGHLSIGRKIDSGNPYFQLIAKNNNKLASKVQSILLDKYGTNPWEIITEEGSKYKGSDLIRYLTQPDEMRVRALKVERIKQTTGKSYDEILNTPEYLQDPDIKQLADVYQKADYGNGQNAVLDFLVGYARKGGRLKLIKRCHRQKD